MTAPPGDRAPRPAREWTAGRGGVLGVTRDRGLRAAPRAGSARADRDGARPAHADRGRQPVGIPGRR